MFTALAAPLFFYGCATSPAITSGSLHANMPGIYHRVEKGQTLWRISKLYRVDLDELIRLNGLPDSSNIEIGQLIFIPKAKRQEAYMAAMPVASDDFLWPVKGKVISSFGQTFEHMVNKGINIMPYGESAILASRQGKVVFYAPGGFRSFGKTVILDHGDGFSTVYAKISQVYVKPGDFVKQGAVIGRIQPQERENNSYLHFEIRKRHVSQNPYFYLDQK